MRRLGLLHFFAPQETGHIDVLLMPGMMRGEVATE